MENLIQWYPGHIAKAQRQLREKINLVDCVIEMVDARLPMSSHFPFVDEVAGHKPRIVVVNKLDLAPPEAVEAGLAHWRNLGFTALSLNIPEREGLKSLQKALDGFYQQLAEKMQRRGRLPRKLRTMVMGLPNVGKSSLINALINKRSMKVGNKPGVTKSLQWIAIAKNLELLDTPGVIPPKLEDQVLALKLALIGSISEYAADPVEVAEAGLELLRKDFTGVLAAMYGQETLRLPDLCQLRGFLVQGGEPDLRRAAEAFLQDVRGGRQHLFWLESPPAEDSATDTEETEAAESAANIAPADAGDAHAGVSDTEDSEA
ncbi:MAG: ribosome biogenesis GTPase YlqF [Candidatus Sericytochromatia bacterium]|nr:ribosome biogenesis GTPase YlqF [Candidatus Sericytochromatia bacterium]